MAYTYTAIVQYQDSNGRFANLTQTPTITAYDLAGNAIAGPSITNLSVGVYKVSVTQNDLEDVVFRVVPHIDDQANFADVALLQEKVYHVTDQLTFTQPNKVDAYLTMTAAQIIAAVSGSSITDIRGNSWVIVIEDLTLSSDKQQFAIKPTHRNAALNQSAPAWNVATPDVDALLFIDSDTGLLYLNGDPFSDPTLGSLVYAGTTLTLTLKPAVTALLPPGTYTYGIQSVDALGVVSEVYGGTFVITADVVRSIT